MRYLLNNGINIEDLIYIEKVEQGYLIYNYKSLKFRKKNFDATRLRSRMKNEQILGSRLPTPTKIFTSLCHFRTKAYC